MDKRHRWSRERWSKNGIHNNVAEGKNGILKRSFGSYVWINPKNSTLYLNEFSFLGNLRYFALEDLLPDESLPTPRPAYQLDRNWELRGFQKNLIHIKKGPLQDRLVPLEYEAKSLLEIKRAEQRSQKQLIKDQLAKVEDIDLARTLEIEYGRLQAWLKAKPTRDERTKQRYYESLAEKVWKAIPRHSYIELHDLARTARISGKHIFRLFGVWTRLGLLDSIDLNRKNKGKAIEYFDIRRNSEVLLPMRYTIKKSDIPKFNKQWRAKLRRFK